MYLKAISYLAHFDCHQKNGSKSAGMVPTLHNYKEVGRPSSWVLAFTAPLMPVICGTRGLINLRLLSALS